ncbi:MAG: hypothetical protein HYX81_00615 [Chloroflexi bacterium]|nr:hypothetical protein [Chloroflexota bacterium]
MNINELKTVCSEGLYCGEELICYDTGDDTICDQYYASCSCLAEFRED